VRTVTVTELASDPRFEIAAAASSRGPRPEIGLEGLSGAAVEEASWWEAHIAEVVYGLPPDAPAGAHPRPQYDPERTSLTERERAKAAELSVARRPVPASTVKHRRQRWEAHGLAGLVDHRAARRMRPAGRADERVADVMRQAIGEAAAGSSRTAGFVIWRTREILAAAGYDGPVPSDRTFYRLFGTLSHGRHVTGSASTRPSLAELLGELAGIGETVRLHQGDRADPAPTATTPVQDKLSEIFGLPLRPRALTWVIRQTKPGTLTDQQEQTEDQLIRKLGIGHEGRATARSYLAAFRRVHAVAVLPHRRSVRPP
jgi:hypothetical protein